MPLDGIDDVDVYSASVNVFEIYLPHTHFLSLSALTHCHIHVV